MKPLTEMPEYRCHKIVRATKVTGLEYDLSERKKVTLITEFGPYTLNAVPGVEYEEGGYLVRYDDGYFSYSPPKPFEDGYSPLDDFTPQVTTSRNDDADDRRNACYIAQNLTAGQSIAPLDFIATAEAIHHYIKTGKAAA